MSTIQVKYPPRDMMPLVERSTLPDVPHRAHWWRVRILPDEDGVAYHTDIDGLDDLVADADSKATVTYSWADGVDESATPFAARITTEHEEPEFLGIEHTRCVPSRATNRRPTMNNCKCDCFECRVKCHDICRYQIKCIKRPWTPANPATRTS